MLPGEVQPVKNSFELTMLNATNGTQAIAFDQHGHNIENGLTISSQCLKEGSSVGAKAALTSGAVETAFSIAIDFDVWRSDLGKVWTIWLIAPLLFDIHCASPLVA
jgi:hypothetical protein